jgi:hypothetical protein
MSDFQLCYFADKVFVHHWPKDTPKWPESFQKKLDFLINKNSQKKQITVNSNTVEIEKFHFFNLKKIGISIPFFKEECTMIFEAKVEDVFAHIHITIKFDNFLEVFNELLSWNKKFHK